VENVVQTLAAMPQRLRPGASALWPTGLGDEDPVELSLYVREPERRLSNEEH
jgi:hypothetical protein